ncbi:hypothetical protein BJ912DRAFT_195857 [Pholiota molesta]|nr:hypothetical protein BJ912DRAFT_195857 [Pholiota molesta]
MGTTACCPQPPWRRRDDRLHDLARHTDTGAESAQQLADVRKIQGQRSIVSNGTTALGYGWATHSVARMTTACLANESTGAQLRENPRRRLSFSAASRDLEELRTSRCSARQRGGIETRVSNATIAFEKQMGERGGRSARARRSARVSVIVVPMRSCRNDLQPRAQGFLQHADKCAAGLRDGASSWPMNDDATDSVFDRSPICSTYRRGRRRRAEVEPEVDGRSRSRRACGMAPRPGPRTTM